MLMFLDQRRHVRYLYVPLAKIAFELDFSATCMENYSAMQVHLTNCVASDRLDTIPNREDNLHSANIFRELFHVVNRISTKS